MSDILIREFWEEWSWNNWSRFETICKKQPVIWGQAERRLEGLWVSSGLDTVTPLNSCSDVIRSMVVWVVNIHPRSKVSDISRLVSHITGWSGSMKTNQKPQPLWLFSWFKCPPVICLILIYGLSKAFYISFFVALAIWTQWLVRLLTYFKPGNYIFIMTIAW